MKAASPRLPSESRPESDVSAETLVAVGEQRLPGDDRRGGVASQLRSSALTVHACGSLTGRPPGIPSRFGLAKYPVRLPG